ncbi:MAG: alkaline phosphatase, partial [Candidatus Tectomicrobia bacterium]|nr:alkaline phosphatase [Candidatus Tectomicrobia bacterium]
ATGFKTKNFMLSILPTGRSVKTVLEEVEERKMRVGLVTTSTVTDATLAAFGAHSHDRANQADIARQYLDRDIDLILGGGRCFFLPKRYSESARSDDRNLIAEFQAHGYAYVSNLAEMKGVNAQKVLGLFTSKDMSLELDRDYENEPSLSEMTQMALKVLMDKNRSGFFVLIESENIDTAAHNNDVASLIHAVREFDRAAAVAYDFYRQYPNETLLIVAADHETGGLSLTTAGNTFPGIEQLRKIASIKISFTKATQLLGDNPSLRSIKHLLSTYYPGFPLTREVKEDLLKKRTAGEEFSNWPQNVLGQLVAQQTLVYWGSSGHTAQPVGVAALGVGSSNFHGYLDNTTFGQILFKLFTSSSQAATSSE